MRECAEVWVEEAIVQQAVGQLPWGHSLVLLARRVLSNSGGHTMLSLQIGAQLRQRQRRPVADLDERLVTRW